ncbi:MAG: T9SS type A sorting domain-containing protein [Flavobacteriales bacterium]|nr:T9SS type A sorting domain-containing protein [Flavobacteriales bacterium]
MVTLTIIRSVVLSAAMVVMVVGVRAQVAGDYVSNSTGPWGAAGTWKVYDGVSMASSPLAIAIPNANKTVWIRSGHTITAITGPYACANLTVEAGGKLFNDDPLNVNSLVYIGIYDSYLNNYGEIGNGGIYDGISFNIEGANVTINGNGIFNAARLNKRGNFHVMTAASQITTNLTINTNINLIFDGTALFNYGDFISSGGSTFNVTISPGYVVALIGANGSVAIDGSAGADARALRGAFTVKGTLTIGGTLYLTTNNSTGNSCRFAIDPGGMVVTRTINATGSGLGKDTLLLNAGSTMEITGTPAAWTAYSTMSNTYLLNAASQVIYSGAGNQDVRNLTGGYGHLRVTGTGTKDLRGVTSVKGNLAIDNVSGTPDLDVTASNHTLSVFGNWTNYSATGFNERNGVVNFNGTNNVQTIATAGGENFYTWRFSKSTAFPLVTMNCNVQVANALELNTAILDLNGNELAILNPAATAITSLFVFSNQRHIISERTDNLSRVRWDIGATTGAHLVPFGTGIGGNYIPFTFNLAAGNAGSVTMATYGTPQNNLPWPVMPIAVSNLTSSVTGLDNSAATVDRFWEVDVTGTPTAGLTFTYTPSELPISPYDDPLSLRAQRWNSGGPLWETQIAGSSAAYSATTDPVVNAFGPFTLTPIVSPLPLELLSFTARLVEEHVQLDWTTASERNNAYFTVYRSDDGERFEEVMREAAVGNSFGARAYSAIDPRPLNGRSYYKLRQTDLDGRWSESAMVPILNEQGGGQLLLFPNPVVDQLTVLGLSAAAGEIVIMDATGRVVIRMRKLEDVDRMTIPVGSLPQGSYVLRTVGGTGVPAARFIKP